MTGCFISEAQRHEKGLLWRIDAPVGDVKLFSSKCHVAIWSWSHYARWALNGGQIENFLLIRAYRRGVNRNYGYSFSGRDTKACNAYFRSKYCASWWTARADMNGSRDYFWLSYEITCQTLRCHGAPRANRDNHNATNEWCHKSSEVGWCGRRCVAVLWPVWERAAAR